MAVLATDWVSQHAYVKPGSTAMIDLASKRTHTYAQMHERVGRAAGLLTSRGVKRGDRVAFLMLNSSDLMEILFACWRVGAICVALNFRLTATELAFILNNSQTSVLFIDKAFSGLVQDLTEQTDVDEFITTDGVGGESDYEIGLAESQPVTTMVDQLLDDPCMLMYSSGTTGTPKGVIITHGMMYFTSSSAVRVNEGSASMVSLCNMPLFHIGALNVTAAPAIWIGGTLVIMRMFDPQATLEAIDSPELGVTNLFMVPAAYNAMRAVPDADKKDFSRIAHALTGGEAVPTDLVKWWYQRDVIIQEGYGMTETAAAGCLLLKEDIPAKLGSAGRSLMHSQIRIVGEDGQTCQPDSPGEIWFRGAAITPGYWKRDDANAESFVNGWFRSGDIGRMDKDGYIYIDDRIKDMYISGGENVYPAEIENLLYQMPQIAEVTVVGVRDQNWGETGCVIAVLKPECTITLDEILHHIGDKLAKFKHPRHLHIMEALPRNGSGKVLKFQLRDSMPSLLGITDLA